MASDISLALAELSSIISLNLVTKNYKINEQQKLIYKQNIIILVGQNSSLENEETHKL